MSVTLYALSVLVVALVAIPSLVAARRSQEGRAFDAQLSGIDADDAPAAPVAVPAAA